MEEDKAAAYYDDLARKGGGAARFKQGLGYSSQSSQQPSNKGNAQSALSNFVKAASPGKAEEIHKEIRIENIREKLQKKGENALKIQKGRDSANSQRTRQEERSDTSEKQGRSRSRSPKRLTEKPHERDRRHSRRDYHSGSPYDKHRRHRSRSAGRASKHSSRRGYRRSYSHSRRNKSTSSDRSRDYRHHRRDSRRSSSRSSSHSYDNDFSRKRGRKRSLSFSGSEEERRSPVSYSRKRAKGRSRSPASRRESSKERKGKLNGSLSPRQKRTGEENIPHRDRKMESKRVSKHNGKEATSKRNASKVKAQETDYSELIDGYDSMTPAEKVKAKMRLQLSETAVKDVSKGTSAEWERFDFNKEAPLDDDAKLDYFGDDTGAKDDTQFLRNTGTTFFASAGQAKRESEIQAAHEAAIFGTLIHSSSITSDLNPNFEPPLQDDQNKDEISCMTSSDTVKDSKGNVLGNSLISEQVYSMQQGSWRDRARKLREQKAEQTRN